MSGIVIDTRQINKALRGVNFTAKDLLDIEGAGAAVMVNGMRMRVPVDTAATRASIKSHIVEATNSRVIDDVGAETNYAPYIEFGVRSKPNYPMQPFVRPTAKQDYKKIIAALTIALKRKLDEKWQK